MYRLGEIPSFWFNSCVRLGLRDPESETLTLVFLPDIAFCWLITLCCPQASYRFFERRMPPPLSKVLLYIPNLLGYFRIVAGLTAFMLGLDGIFGATLDVVADIFLRSLLWFRLTLDVIATYWSLRFIFTAVCLSIISLEWSCCVASQMTAAYTGRPWKGGQGQQSAAEGFTPTYSPFVKRVLKNGLKSPLGAWAVIGLYGTPVCGLLVATSPDGHAAAAVLPHWVLTSILLPLCITGRIIAFVLMQDFDRAE
ncbi:hypothetical protein FOZ60_001282 [Perkinsus olseni]|uniref:Uncharacterized protein n=1 Tax=Perkinsus olseni TaxID=32597 RepID=A0A7J6P0L7_PEROL|nr:hypothetical protein FOZ60_001282 [Perkinsus olseni]